jgi:hypothetical protein
MIKVVNKHKGNQMAKQKQKKGVIDTSQSATYYASRLVQRITLLLAAMSTVILWATLVTVTNTFSIFGAIQDEKLNTLELNRGITYEIDKLTSYAVFFSVLAILVTLLLLTLPRVKKYEKRLVADGLVIAGFCLIASAECQTIMRFILTRISL